MTQSTFDHERLDVYHLGIEYVAFSYRIAKTLGGVNRQARDQWLRAAQSIPLNIAEGNVLQVCDAIDEESNRRGKSDLKRIVSMLTRLIQRTETVSEESIEYEYRDAEYEYESDRIPEP